MGLFPIETISCLMKNEYMIINFGRISKEAVVAHFTINITLCLEEMGKISHGSVSNLVL